MVTFRKALMKHLRVDVPLIDAIYDYRRVSIGLVSTRCVVVF